MTTAQCRRRLRAVRGMGYSTLLLAVAGQPTLGAIVTGEEAGPSAAAESSFPVSASPSVLPATGFGPNVRVGDLSPQSGAAASGLPLFGRGAFNRPVEPGSPAWTIASSLSLTEEYTTGGESQGAVTNQFITTLQPDIVLSGQTTRLNGELSYTPQLELYSRDGDQNHISQDFNGRLLATLLPQTLFLDLRGSGFVQPVTAGQAPSQTNTLDRGATTQTYSFSASPYALHRFGPWGTGEVGGSIGRTTQNALQTSGQPVLMALAAASNQNVTSTSFHVAFTTGEQFARYNGAALGQITSFDGSGVLSGAYRDIASLDNGYALARTITALARIGWERIHYAGSSPVDINDAIWNAGVRLEPNADSTITIRYGHQDGLNSPTVDAVYQPTARTRIYARYSAGLTTQAEQLQNVLATSDLDTQGNPVDHLTGAPLVAAGTFFGVQNCVYKTKLASLTCELILARDTLSVSVNSQTQTLISASSAAGLANGSSRGTYGVFNWGHELSRNLQSTLYMQYGVQSGGIGSGGLATGDQQLLAISAALSTMFSATLSGRVQYSYNQTFGGQESASQAFSAHGGQSLVLASVVKSF